MEIVPNDYCNECRRNTNLIVTGTTDDSIFATCPHCNAKFDLINDGYRVKKVLEKKLSQQQVEIIIKEMVNASEEVDEYRNSIVYNEDDEYVGYREGLYDAYLNVLHTVGYSVSEITRMEERLSKGNK